MTHEAERIISLLRQDGCAECDPQCKYYNQYYKTGCDSLELELDAADLLERISKENDALQIECNAAINDARLGGHCIKCRYNYTYDESEECKKCCYGCGDNDCWKWRGVCEENLRGVTYD